MFEIANTRHRPGRENRERTKKNKTNPTVDDFAMYTTGHGLKASQKICSGQRGKTHKNSDNDVTSFASLMHRRCRNKFPRFSRLFVLSSPLTYIQSPTRNKKKKRKKKQGNILKKPRTIRFNGSE